jgi:hypothetical protein
MDYDEKTYDLRIPGERVMWYKNVKFNFVLQRKITPAVLRHKRRQQNSGLHCCKMQ